MSSPSAAKQEILDIRTAAVAKLKGALQGTSYAGSLPNAKGSEQLDHQGYIRELKDTIAWCDEQLRTVDGPTISISQGLPQ